MADICVVYLVRAQNGIEPLQKFLDSYGRNRGGLKHDFCVLFKGFPEEKEPTKYEQRLSDYPHRSLFVRDFGYDITSYFIAARTLDYPYFCFLNSYSLILDENWLTKMYRYISEKDVGLVGATGSYESIYSDFAEQYRIMKTILSYRRIDRRLWMRYCLMKHKSYFFPFPNYHIRTNAFMIRGTLMRKICLPRIHTKMDAWRFESGKDSLTQQVLRMNLRVLVIGKDGIGYNKEDWFKSNTFWQGNQDNLLIADNQTNEYSRGDVEAKKRHSRLAWADNAGLPAESQKPSEPRKMKILNYATQKLHRTYKPRLIPANQIKPASDGEPGRWESTGTDPQFYMTGSLPDGSVKVTYAASSEKPGHFKLYVDSGEGFLEGQSFKIGFVTDKEESYSIIVSLGPRVLQLRLDPGEYPAYFVIKKLKLTRVSKMGVMVGTLSRVLRRSQNLSFKGVLSLLIWLIFTLREEGYKGLKIRLANQIRSQVQQVDSYKLWMKMHGPSPPELDEMWRKSAALLYQPKFSIVVQLFNAKEHWLRNSIESILAQAYTQWEVCLADDGSVRPDVQKVLQEYEGKDRRIRVLYRKEAGATIPAWNNALSLATGDFVCLMGSEDELSPNALFEFAHLLNLYPNTDMIYTDEDKMDKEGRRFEPFFKPDWSPEYFESYMYIGHFACYRMGIAKKIGGFRSGYERAEDYDFVLRFVEQTEKILHIPKILYHAREVPPSTDSSVNTQGNRTNSIGRVLKERLERLRVTGTVIPGPFEGCSNVRYDIKGNPLISIIIPSAGRSVQIQGKSVDLLSNCINNIHEKSTYNNYEIIVVDNDDLRQSTVKAIKPKDCIFVHFKGPFNIAQKINLGAQYARGEYLLLLNDDTEVISPDWLTAMLQLAQRREIGAVGAKLYFEDGTIQHVGVTFIGGLPDHIYRGFPGRFPGYFFSSAVNRNYLAVTGACLMTRKEVFKRVEGFNEDFAMNYNDIDYCLKVHEAGYRIVYASQAELFHYESKCRERTVDPKEIYLFLRLWHFKTKQDPYYSIHLETRPPNFEIKV